MTLSAQRCTASQERHARASSLTQRRGLAKHPGNTRRENIWAGSYSSSLVRKRAVFKSCSCKPFPPFSFLSFFFFILTHSLIFEKHKPFLWLCVIFLHVSINLVFEEVTGILVICQQYPQRICECHREVPRVNSFLNLHVPVIPYSLVHTQEAYYIWLAIS